MNAIRRHEQPRPAWTAQTVPIDWSTQPRWAEWAIMDAQGRWWVYKNEPELVARYGVIDRSDWFADESYDQGTGEVRFYARMANEPDFGLKHRERIQWMDSKRSRQGDRERRRRR